MGLFKVEAPTGKEDLLPPRRARLDGGNQTVPRILFDFTDQLACGDSETTRQTRFRPSLDSEELVKRESHSGGKGSRGSVTCQQVSDKSCKWLRLWYVVVHPSPVSVLKKGSVHTSGLPVWSRIFLSAGSSDLFIACFNLARMRRRRGILCNVPRFPGHVVSSSVSWHGRCGRKDS